MRKLFSPQAMERGLYKVLVPWCMLLVRDHLLKKKNQQSVSFELLTADGFDVKLLKICLSPKHFCVYVSVLTSPIGHVSDYDQSASVSSSRVPPLLPPTPNLYSVPIIFWSAATSEQTAIRREGAAAWLCDTWQVLQLWSVFCKESLAAENAAVSRRFTAQSLQSIPLPGFFPRAGGDGDISLHRLLSHTFHYQFVYFIF